MLEFLYIKIWGFGSIIDPLKYKLNTQGLTVIIGENGVGKTTIFSAFSWGIFGQTLKQKNSPIPWEDIQPRNFKGTKVCVCFKKKGIKYKIYRHEKYKEDTMGTRGGSRLVLIEGGKERTDLKHKMDIQKEINTLLGFSFDLFKNSIIFGQKMRRIIEEKGPMRNKIFEEVFEVMFISKAKKRAEEKKKKLEKQLWELNPSIQVLEERLKNNRNLKKDYQSQIDKFKEKQEFEIKNLRELLKVKRGKIKDLGKTNSDDLIAKIGDLENTLNTLKPKENEHFKLDFGIEQLKGDIDNQESVVTGFLDDFKNIVRRCPACRSKISKDKIIRLKNKIKQDTVKAKEIQSSIYIELDKREGELKKLSKELSSLARYKDQLTRYKNDLKELEKTKNKKGILKVEISFIKGNLKKLKHKTLNLDIPKIQGIVTKTKGELEPLNQDKKRLMKRLDLLSWVIKDPLSNSGLKAYIFEEMLKLINRELLVYSKVLGWKIKFNIDLSSKRKDFITTVYQNSKERFYEDLSGGQQQLVNSCIAFAIHDVVNLERDCNILIMDEPFESLSKNNIHIITDLIKEKSKNKSVHLITHLTEFNPTDCNLIQLELNKRGRTYIAA